MDEDALVNALDSGRVLSVGLDVYQQEPNIHPGLVSNPHVCLLPHMGTSTVEVGCLSEESVVLTGSLDQDDDGKLDDRKCPCWFTNGQAE